MTPEQIIAALGLAPHPEGGHYRETWRHVASAADERGAGTAIYFLLHAGEESRWHRVDAAEIWHHYTGGPLEIELAAPGAARTERHVLGGDLERGQRPQLVVPAGVWQRARPLGTFALVGCTVSPAFEFAGFELAAPGWRPVG